MYGIGDSSLQWVQRFLSSTCRRPHIRLTPVTSGVPQGTVLGPLLFLFYINDMPMKVSSTARLFADDSLLYQRIRSSQDSISPQEDLDSLQQWEKEWQMSLNPTKCVVVWTTRKRNPINTTYNIHNSKEPWSYTG